MLMPVSLVPFVRLNELCLSQGLITKGHPNSADVATGAEKDENVLKI